MGERRLGNIIALKADEAAEREEGQDVAPVVGWPGELGPAAYHGLAGQIVRALEPHTEADPVALLVQLLAAVGNVADLDWYTDVEDTQHPAKIFPVLVGPSGTGRKGTAWQRVLALLDRTRLQETWCQHRVYRGGGLSTGEGLIYRVRDGRLSREDMRSLRQQAAGKPIADKDWAPSPNVDRDWNPHRLREDGRLLTVETEFGRVLRVLQRDGNTLGPIIRQVWDGRYLRVVTKEEAAASFAHVTIIGHVTRDTVIELLAREDVAGGTANRFLWFAVRRHHLLPDGGQPPDHVLNPLIVKLDGVLEWLEGPAPSPLHWDEAAYRLWVSAYPELTRELGGTMGVILNRREAQAKRLALVYSLLDLSSVIREPHLRAALEILRYAQDSVRWIWGEGMPPEADRILDALKNEGSLTRTQVSRLFGRRPPKELGRLLQDLEAMGRIAIGTEKTDGRPKQVITLLREETE